MLSFQLLGKVSLVRNGQILDHFRSRKEVALLVYLAHNGDTYPREFIADLLWEGRSTQRALSNLRTVIMCVRKQVGDELLVRRNTLALAPESRQQVDSVILLQTLAALQQVDSPQKAGALQAALYAYQGPFLADFHLTDAPEFDQWITTTRAEIQRKVMAAYARLTQYALAAGDLRFGVATARRWLEADPLDEAAHTLLIQLAAQG